MAISPHFPKESPLVPCLAAPRGERAAGSTRGSEEATEPGAAAGDAKSGSLGIFMGFSWDFHGFYRILMGFHGIFMGF